MSSEFQKTNLGKLITFANGKSSPERFDNAKFAVFGSNGLIGNANESNSPANSIVVGRVGSYCGAVHFSRHACWVTDNAIKATVREDNDPSFLFYLLKHINLNNWRSGSGQPLINQSTLNAIEVCVPPSVEQKAIGGFVSSLDDRITLLRETNATLEAIAQALFKSWFVNFDPVHAKQQGRALDGMDEATTALFPDSFEESELGLVPKGWRVGSFLDLVHQHKGSLNPLSHPDIVFEHYSLPAFDSGQMPVFEAGTEIKSNKTSVPSSAVLLSKLNPHIPRIWMPASAGATAVCSTEFLVFTPVGGASKEFVYCCFSAPEFQQLLCQLVTGTSNSHQRVKPDGVLAMRRIVPSPSVLASFEAITRHMFERIGHNRQQAQTLATLRDTLLPRLISGQLRLPEASSVA
jgi:type I restriction enzyme S subunit